MKLGIIGCGAIGTDVANAAENMEEIEKIDKDKLAEAIKDRLYKMLVHCYKEYFEEIIILMLMPSARIEWLSSGGEEKN
jgi:predicted dinucleotide-utilizing enzyme